MLLKWNEWLWKTNGTNKHKTVHALSANFSPCLFPFLKFSRFYHSENKSVKPNMLYIHLIFLILLFLFLSMIYNSKIHY